VLHGTCGARVHCATNIVSTWPRRAAGSRLPCRWRYEEKRNQLRVAMDNNPEIRSEKELFLAEMQLRKQRLEIAEELKRKQERNAAASSDDSTAPK